jgi:hypothetical protein
MNLEVMMTPKKPVSRMLAGLELAMGTLACVSTLPTLDTSFIETLKVRPGSRGKNILSPE